VGSMTKMRVEMKRNQNRTSYIELGLAGLMNFSLEIDSVLKLVQVPVLITPCFLRACKIS
jgi:hypothetical protein